MMQSPVEVSYLQGVAINNKFNEWNYVPLYIPCLYYGRYIIIILPAWAAYNYRIKQMKVPNLWSYLKIKRKIPSVTERLLQLYIRYLLATIVFLISKRLY